MRIQRKRGPYRSPDMTFTTADIDPTRSIPTEMARLAREAFGILGRYDGEVRIQSHPTPDVEPWALTVGVTVFGHPEFSRPKHRHIVAGGLEPDCIWPNIMSAAALASDRAVPKTVATGLAVGVLAAACVPRSLARSGMARVAIGSVAATLGFDMGARMATARADVAIVDALAGSERIGELVRYVEHLHTERPTLTMNTLLLPRLTQRERFARARKRLASAWALEIVKEPKESHCDLAREEDSATHRPTRL